MGFDAFSFDPRIAAGIKAAGYTTPTPIQERAIPLVIAGRDVLGIAQTGTGKTAAFVLPILERLVKKPSRHVRALIVAPTRELAEQIHQATVSLSGKTGVRSVAIYGGVGKSPQIAALRRGTEIVVACPGRLLDHLDDRNIDLSHVEVLVLDEADRMCDMGFLPDVRRILRALPKERQTLFFSATMPRDIRLLADSILRNPATVQIGTMTPVETVSHALYPAPEGLKAELLLEVLRQTPTERVLIFTRTKHRADSLARRLANHGHRVSALQGDMPQRERQRAINGFRDGRYDLLVATDIAARGIDVPGISHVINFDVPDTVDAYTHRIGRTGRVQETGEAFTLAGRADELLVADIERALGARIERRRLPNFDYGTTTVTSPSRPTRPVAARRADPRDEPAQARSRPTRPGIVLSGSHTRRRNTAPALATAR